MANISITVAQFRIDLAGKIHPPTGDDYIVSDISANLETLTVDEITALPALGGIAVTATDATRPVFDLVTQDALATAPVTIEPNLGTTLSVSGLLSLEANPSLAIPGVAYYVSDSAANIQSLTAAQILKVPADVTALAPNDGSIAFNLGQALALESVTLPIVEPSNDKVTLADTAAKVVTLTDNQLQALGALNFTGIAGTDAPPVFAPDQVLALTAASVAITAPPGDPQQIYTTTTIEGPAGNGMTFVVNWSPAAASAPAQYMIDIGNVLQFYADTFVDPNIVYLDVNPATPGASSVTGSRVENYGSLVSFMTADATSEAQLAAVATLPSADPTGGMTLKLAPALAQELGFSVTGISASNPDGAVNLGDRNLLTAVTGPAIGALINPDLGAAAHEISEVLGRTSSLSSSGSAYSPIDLFRYSAPATRQLTTLGTANAYGDGSYFSIDNGTTNLKNFNNWSTSTSGDLADWRGGSPYVPDSFNASGGPGNPVDPVTSVDVTLMNVLGYTLAAPTAHPTLSGKTAIPVTVGELMVDLSMDQITPGRNDAPAGHAYIVTDTAFATEWLTPAEITAGAAMGVAEFYVTDASPYYAVSQAEDIESLGIPIVVPSGDTASVGDASATVEAMSDAQLVALAPIGVQAVAATDAVTTTWSADVGGDWATAAGWASGTVPAAANTVTIAASGTSKYTVTSAADVSVFSLALGSKATLSLTAGTFTAIDDVDSGTIKVGAGATLYARHSLTGTGTVDLSAGTALLPGGAASSLAFSFAGAAGGTLELGQAASYAGTLNNLGAGDRLEVAGITFNSASLDTTTGVLTLRESGTPVFTFNNVAMAAGASNRFTTGVDASTSNDYAVVACFASGTRIATEFGPVEVEALRPGDRVLTAFDGSAPVVWTGHRRIDCRRHKRRQDVLPVRVRAHAFGPGLPAADLVLSPDHAVFVEGALIPIRLLVNGGSIAQEEVDDVTYHHVELPNHGVILAEGLPCESYLDTGNRAAFANGGNATPLHPAFTASLRETKACAELVVEGPRLRSGRKKAAR